MNHESKKIVASKVRLMTITALVTLLVGGGTAYLLGYLSPSRNKMPEKKNQAMVEMAEEKKVGHEKNGGSQMTEKEQRKIRYWRSSMDPTEVYDQPGKDRMGMDLVPVYEGEASAGPPGTVKIDPVTIQNIGVRTTVVQRKRLTREIRTVGRIVYNEEKVRQISPKIGGWVERQYVNFAGQVVEKGQRLLEIYSPELVSTQEEYLTALRYRERLNGSLSRQALAASENLLRAAKNRLRYWDITEDQVRALRDRGVIIPTMALHAPFKGIIVHKNILEGGYVQPGQDLYRIADLSTVWVFADVYEYEAPWVKLGQGAVMTLAYQPGTSYRGKVTYIYPYLKNKTRTLQIRMEFPNSEGFTLKPDMWANITLRSEVTRQGLAVPIQAIIRTGKRDLTLVALEGGRFSPRELHLGAQIEEEFEVLHGLNEGERVVTSAQFLINSESNLQAAISKMMEEKQEEHKEHPAEPQGKMPELTPAKPSSSKHEEH